MANTKLIPFVVFPKVRYIIARYLLIPHVTCYNASGSREERRYTIVAFLYSNGELKSEVWT